MQKKEDRRVVKTRNLLHEALLDLMIEKGYEAITVQDIIDRANVGRSTFYSHFIDKEQLLESTINQLRDFLKHQSTVHQSTEEHRFGFSLAMLEHVQSNRLIYKATVSKKGGAVVLQYMQRIIADLTGDSIEQLLAETASLPVPKVVAVDFVVNTFLILLAWWVDQNIPCSATELDGIFHNMTLRGLNAFQLNNKDHAHT